MKEKVRLVVVTVLLAFGLIVSNSGLLFSQEPDAFTLEEITVTAQKREENLQKTPITMESISGHDLAEMGKTTLEDILNDVAGVSIQQSGAQLNVVIRGMDNDEGARSSFSMVAINTDGVYSNNRESGSVGIYDMARVEVLSGPQSTLYSRNAAGGVVNFISNNPKIEKFEGSGLLELGNYQQLTMTGVLNVPLNDKWAVRAAFNSNSHEGYVSNGTYDNDTKETRIKLGYYPNEDLSMIFTYELYKQGGMGKTGVDPFEDEDDTSNPWTNNSPTEDWRLHRKTDKANLNLNWTTPIGTVTFLPAINKGDVPWDVQSRSGLEDGEVIYTKSTQTQTNEERSVELRLSSLDDWALKWLVGLYYFNRETEQWQGTRYEYQENPSKSAFGNITYPITDTFRATAGLRYTSDEEHWISEQSDTSALMPGQEAYSNERYSSSNTDYKLGVEYDLDEQTMIWADFSTGYKHVFRNAESQKLYSYQLGAKSRFLDSKLQVNATAFYYDYSNYVVMVEEDYTILEDGEHVVYTDMGTGLGAATVYGLDLSTNYILSIRDRIDFQAAFLHTEVSDLTITYLYYYPDSEEFNGVELNNSPDFTGTLSYQHVFDLWNGGSIKARISTRYQAKTQLSFFLQESQVPTGMDIDKINYEPAHNMTDFSLNYSDPSDKWTLNCYVKNIENHCKKFMYGNSSLMVGPPRTYGAVLQVKF